MKSVEKLTVYVKSIRASGGQQICYQLSAILFEHECMTK